MSDKLKKQLILNLPYILIGLYATKLGEAWRLAEGADASQKFLRLMDGFPAAFQSPLPSFHLSDLLIGLVIGCVLRLLVYEKSRNAKKYRRNEEYGSARWGTAQDIQPYIDPVFSQNVLLTQTERLTMNNRPKDPRTTVLIPIMSRIPSPVSRVSPVKTSKRFLSSPTSCSVRKRKALPSWSLTRKGP